VIDMLKLDHGFTSTITSERGRIILRSLVALTDSLAIDLVAEGIEDHLTQSLLIEVGCTLGQGHLFARAMPLATARHWQRHHSR
jgi:EAL domain-containing protein (putative c-di-GMP-specific phosphodiesterase class I)